MPSSKKSGFQMTVGTRAQVWHGTAKKTSGGLMKSNLLQNKNGRIVSKSKHNSAKKEKRLVKAGYLTKKGKFGFVKSGTRKHHKGKHQRGGSPYGAAGGIADAAAPFGTGVTEYSGDSLQMQAGQAGGRRRRRGSRRGRRGGSALGGSLTPASFDASTGAVGDNMPSLGNGIAGQGITASSEGGVLSAALTAGGKRRRHRRGRGKRGGTTDASSMGYGLGNNNPQIMAGLGN
jgi:hypothetical protein